MGFNSVFKWVKAWTTWDTIANGVLRYSAHTLCQGVLNIRLHDTRINAPI